MPTFEEEKMQERLSNNQAIVESLNREQVKQIIDDLVTRYGWRDDDGRSELILSDDFKSRVGIDVWSWFAKFLADQKDVIVFFNQGPEKQGYFGGGFQFQSGKEAYETMSNYYPPFPIPWTECYLTNPNLDFCLYYFHEEAVYAAGTARVWLEQLTDQVFQRAGIEPTKLTLSQLTVKDYFSELLLECTVESMSETVLKVAFAGCYDLRIKPASDRQSHRIWHLVLDTLTAPEYMPYHASISGDNFDAYFDYKSVEVTLQKKL